MTRVLRILNRLNLGGPTLNASFLTKDLAPEFDTTLVAGQRDATEASSEFIVRREGLEPRYIESMHRSLHPVRDIRALRDLRQAIRELKPTIVHTHAAKAGAVGRTAALLERVPIVVHTFHGHVLHSYFGPLKTRLFITIERALGKRTTRIVAISPQQRDELSDRFRVAPYDRFVVIPLGFDLSAFSRDVQLKRKAFRAEWGFDDEDVVVGIVGRLVPIKNHQLFLEALARARKSCPQLRGLIVGDGEDREAVEAAARQLGLTWSGERGRAGDSEVTFTSWRQDIDAVNAGLDIAALSSLNEGTPVSLIEAHATARPVIATRVGGVADIVADGASGVLVDSGDVEAFANALVELAGDPERRATMGLCGEKHVKARYARERLVSDMRALYRSLLEEHEAGRRDQ